MSKPFKKSLYWLNSKSILVINEKGQLSRKVCPFYVRSNTTLSCIKEGGSYAVDEVFMDKEHIILYDINSKLYSYLFFEIA